MGRCGVRAINFETLARLNRMEQAIAQLEKAVLTLKTQVEEMKQPEKREVLTLRKNRVG